MRELRTAIVTPPWLLILLITIAFSLKIALAVSTYGTNDALTWEADFDKITNDGGLAIYRDGAVPHHGSKKFVAQQFSHPPFMIRVISAWGWLAAVTSLPLRFWIRLSCSIADVISAVLLMRILRRGQTKVSPLAVLLMILSPISILISGFHVNTDPIMMSFVLLSMYLVLRGSPPWLVGCALGMAINIKIVSIIFVPAICFYVGERKKSLAVAAGAGLVVFVGSLPEIVSDPVLIFSRLVGYSSTAYVWGLSFLTRALLPKYLYTAYPDLIKPVMLLALLGVSIRMNMRRAVPLILQIACVAFLCLSLIPGFGVQYVAWLVPWTAILSVRHSILFHTASALFLVAFYHRASGGSWYLANTIDIREPLWGGGVGFLALLFWLVICVITATLTIRSRIGQCGHVYNSGGPEDQEHSFYQHVALLVVLGWAGGFYFG